MCLSALLPAQTVKDPSHPLRSGCSDTDPEVARLKQGDAVKIRFGVQGTASGPCYSVAVEVNGERLTGYLPAKALEGLEDFERARRAAPATSPEPLITRGKVTGPRRGPPKSDPGAAQRVPDFSVAALDEPGKAHTNYSLAGRTYLIDFWAVWCRPCVSEMPHLHQVYDKYKERNFEILSVSLDRRPEDVARFRQKWKMPWLHAYAAGGFDNETARRFRITGIPAPILVDAAGRIIARGGRLRGKNLEYTLGQALERAVF